MNNESPLREKAREAIRNGKLPTMEARRTWGGPGSGTVCSMCGEPVRQGEMELEVEYRRDGKTSDLGHYFFHIRCFAAWQCESRNHLAHRTNSSNRLAGAPSEATEHQGEPLQLDRNKQ
jgi:hypothetical protein